MGSLGSVTTRIGPPGPVAGDCAFAVEGRIAVAHAASTSIVTRRRVLVRSVSVSVVGIRVAKVGGVSGISGRAAQVLYGWWHVGRRRRGRRRPRGGAVGPW